LLELNRHGTFVEHIACENISALTEKVSLEASAHPDTRNETRHVSRGREKIVKV